MFLGFCMYLLYLVLQSSLPTNYDHSETLQEKSTRCFLSHRDFPSTHLSLSSSLPPFPSSCSPESAWLLELSEEAALGVKFSPWLVFLLQPPGGNRRRLGEGSLFTWNLNIATCTRAPYLLAFGFPHCTLPGCSDTIINKYLWDEGLLWKRLGEVWGYLASVDKVDFMIYFQIFHQQ